jgi:hypothetical protein
MSNQEAPRIMAEKVKDHLKGALRLMLKPLVRLLIAQGVTHAEFSETAKEVYVESALRDFEIEGKVNKSRVAILTGLTRKEVKNVIDRVITEDPRDKKHSRPERVLAGWFNDPVYTGPYGIPLDLPYVSANFEEPSFTDLVKSYSGDMAPKQMLDELVRSGSVVEIDGRYKAVRRNYVHEALSPKLIRRLGEIGYRVFSTAAKNIDKEAEGSGYFDRQVFADEGCTDNVISMFDHYIKERGQSFLEEIDVWFSANEKNNIAGQVRKSTGFYMVHYVDDLADRSELRDILENRGVEVEAD